MWWGLEIPYAGIWDIVNESLDYSNKISIRMSIKYKEKNLITRLRVFITEAGDLFATIFGSKV